MTILYIYIGSVVISLAIDIFSDKYVAKEIENIGYEHKKKPKNIYKTIISGAKRYAYFFFPVWNLIIAGLEILKIEEICDDYIKESINNGKLIKKEEAKPVEEIIDKNQNIDLTKNNIIIYNTHNELTIEEKIKFLKEEYARLAVQELETNIPQKGDRQNQKRR